MAIAIFKKSMDSQLATWGSEFDLGMMYFPNEELRNPRILKITGQLKFCFLLLWQQTKETGDEIEDFFFEGINMCSKWYH